MRPPLDDALKQAFRRGGLSDRHNRDTRLPELQHDRMSFRNGAAQPRHLVHQHGAEAAPLGRLGIRQEPLPRRTSNGVLTVIVLLVIVLTVDVPADDLEPVRLGELRDLPLLGSDAELSILIG